MPPRRDFLASLAATAAAGLTLPRALAAEDDAALPPAPAAPGEFDDRWTARVRAAKHRAVFDAPEIADGLGLWQAWLYRRGLRDALGVPAGDVVPVVVLRHAATAMAVDDALWAKYELGKHRKVDDPVTKAPAVRNPWARALPDAPPPDARQQAILGGDPAPTVAGLVASGAVVLTCGLALGQIATAAAGRANADREAVLREFRAGLVPGVVVQPSGVYATLRAQEAGCVFLRSTY
jgi:hypothetical protein